MWLIYRDESGRDAAGGDNAGRHLIGLLVADVEVIDVWH